MHLDTAAINKKNKYETFFTLLLITFIGIPCYVLHAENLIDFCYVTQQYRWGNRNRYDFHYKNDTGEIVCIQIDTDGDGYVTIDYGNNHKSFVLNGQSITDIDDSSNDKIEIDYQYGKGTICITIEPNYSIVSYFKNDGSFEIWKQSH